MEVDVDLLSPNDHQPRLSMDDAKLEELSQSIKSNGIIQPILVRRDGPGTASSRASVDGARATRRSAAGSCLVQEVSPGDQQLLELALIENLQRENLNPVDEALAYQRLAEDFSLTQDQIAAAVGKDRSSVANFMRLLKLPEEIRGDLAAGRSRPGMRVHYCRYPMGRHSGKRPAKSFPGGCRCAKPKRSSSGFLRREPAGRGAIRLIFRRTFTREQRRTSCASPWERKSALSGEARAVESRWISPPKPS